MNKRSLILAILLIFVIILSSNTVLAEEITDNTQLQQSDDVAIIEEINDDKLSSEQTVTAGSNSSAIQEKINSLSDGDTLNFEAGEYRDICIYIDKNITVNGNGAKLIGYDTPSKENTPELIWKGTNESGYAIGNLATVYILKTTGVTLNGLTIVGGANSAATYSNALIYAYKANNLTVKNNTLDGSSWGLYFQLCPDGIVKENTIKNQKVTGFLNFGSARTVIEQNRIINAKNHGIDVRHGTGPDVQVINNTVIGSKEGIYLMHSQGHTAANNTLINCTISSITCYGSSNINLYGNKMQKSRIGILLGGGYKNITVGENTFALDNLPYPPTFVYYVAEAKSDYQSAEDIMGTHSDSSTYSPNYIAYTAIKAPKDIAINYDSILEKTGTEWSVPEGCSSENIQTMIDGMNDGDSLSFAKNAVYNDISIYTDKNIKIFGNNATLIGFNTIDLNNVPEKVRKETAQGGYAIAYRAVLYIINTTGTVVSDLNIVAKYPGYDTTKATTTTDEYKTAGIYGDKNENLVITGCDVSGASWGIFQQYSSNGIISKNSIRDSYTTGIMNFGSPNALIVENNIINAINHGIDTRHGTGPNVTIAFNTISGAKEGIYLMHSKGHTVYNNTVKDCKISGITAYGSGNEVIFNNTILGSRIAILLGGGYENVTIGTNSYSLDSLPFPPTFVTFLAKAENKYQSKDDVIRTYSDKETVTIKTTETGIITVGYKENGFKITLTDCNGNGISKQIISASIGGENFTAQTDEKGIATFTTGLNPGSYNAAFIFAGTDNYAGTQGEAILNITNDRTATVLNASDKSVYLQTIVKGDSYQITLKDINGNALAGKEITVEFNEVTYKANTNANGVATVTLKANQIGSLKTEISFAGDEVYKPSSITTTIKITNESSNETKPNTNGTSNETKPNTNGTSNETKPSTNDDRTPTALSASDKNVYLQAIVNGNIYQITLKDAKGNALAGKEITVKFNGVTYKANTNANGVATVTLKANQIGSLKTEISFAGDEVYKPSSKTTTVKITKEASKLTAKKKTFKAKTKTKKYTVTLKSKSGKSIANAKLIIKVKNKKFTAKTNAKGKATFKITKLTKKGTYKSTVTFQGNKYFNKVSKKVKITVKK